MKGGAVIKRKHDRGQQEGEGHIGGRLFFLLCDAHEGCVKGYVQGDHHRCAYHDIVGSREEEEKREREKEGKKESDN